LNDNRRGIERTHGGGAPHARNIQGTFREQEVSVERQQQVNGENVRSRCATCKEHSANRR
jgi:hypothetical protein